MTISDSGAGRTEPLGVSLPATTAAVDTNPLMAVFASQLERLSATVGKLESRMDMGDHRVSEIPAAIRPPPAPPFPTLGLCSLPAFSTGMHPQNHTMPFVTAPASWSTIPHTLGASYTTVGPSHSFAGQYLSLPQTLGVLTPSHVVSAKAPPYSLPPYGINNGMSIPATSARLQQQIPQQWQPDPSGFGVHDRTPLQRPQLINPASCWGPPAGRPQFGGGNHEAQFTRVKMEAPRFDGTEVNNWIRGVQYYFDHVGTPEAHRLHYVIMLFEPNVADWVWNYAASHECVT